MELIYFRPVSANVRWVDIEALLLELGGELDEREGSRVEVFFLAACKRRGIEPRKHFSGKFSLRVDPATHEAAALAAAAQGQSLNQWALEAIQQAARTG